MTARMAGSITAMNQMRPSGWLAQKITEQTISVDANMYMALLNFATMISRGIPLDLTPLNTRADQPFAKVKRIMATRGCDT